MFKTNAVAIPFVGFVFTVFAVSTNDLITTADFTTVKTEGSGKNTLDPSLSHTCLLHPSTECVSQGTCPNNHIG